MSNSAINEKKIDLTAISQSYFAQKRAEKKARSLTYVEDTLLPSLINAAKTGTRFYCLKIPVELSSDDVITALHERTNCKVSHTGREGKISISW